MLCFWACLLCVCCAVVGYARSWDVGTRLSNLVGLALTIFKLCIFKLKLERASEEPENYIVLSLAKSKHKI